MPKIKAKGENIARKSEQRLLAETKVATENQVKEKILQHNDLPHLLLKSEQRLNLAETKEKILQNDSTPKIKAKGENIARKSEQRLLAETKVATENQCRVEEVQGPTQARAHKGRFISGDLFDLSKDNIQIKESKVQGILLSGATENYYEILAKRGYCCLEQQRICLGLQFVLQRWQLYAGSVSKLRMLMICRMAKPEEVLIIEDENGDMEERVDRISVLKCSNLILQTVDEQ
ncbi:hypothetical protein CJ030_MR3G001206 [Morella rubra]|uniref:Uncharacterized protein n=1 Tax=Morella rubra TaxID=262757 RepID=A0A6A1W286_9ROSI|nr:hypothetical protein CJ030_MR3G001206 [Morella rubra]